MQRMESPKQESEKILDNGPLEYLFNGAAVAKIIDFMDASQELDYSESDIARYSGVNVRTVQREIKKLEGLNLIKHTRVVGKAKMWKFNKESKTGQYTDKLAVHIASARNRTTV